MLIDCEVIYVDTDRMTLDCLASNGSGDIYPGVSYSELGTSGEGIEIVPEIGSAITIELIRGEASIYKPRIERFNHNGLTRIRNFIKRFTPNTVFARKKLPGDVSISAPNGAGALFGRGRSASIFSGDLAQLHVLGVMNVIKAIATNYDVVGSGFRAYTVNENGKVLTRLCFTSDSSNMMKGSSDFLADNFEFQIDIDGPNLTIFSGSLNKDGKRENKIIASFMSCGEVVFRCGDNISQSGITTELRVGNGIIRETIASDANDSGVNQKLYERVVTKTMGAPENQRAIVTEHINGSVHRIVTGDVTETIAGTHNKNVNISIETGLAKETNYNTVDAWANVNNSEMKTESNISLGEEE